MIGHLARRGPLLFVAVEAGQEPVARPPNANQCHGLSLPKNGVGGGKYVVCDRAVRPGKLTCGGHRHRERAARDLAAEARQLPSVSVASADLSASQEVE
jgi:hypothetical protein